MIGETNDFEIQVDAVLSKFEGEPLPENEVERIHIRNGEITAIDTIENGIVVSSRQVRR